MLPDLTGSYFIDTLWHQHNESPFNQWYGLESPEIDSSLYDKMILDKDAKRIHWGKKNKPWSLPYIMQKKKSPFEMDHGPIYESQEYKVLEENIGNDLHNLGGVKHFSSKTQKRKKKKMLN